MVAVAVVEEAAQAVEAQLVVATVDQVVAEQVLATTEHHRLHQLVEVLTLVAVAVEVLERVAQLLTMEQQVALELSLSGMF
jgi:hypothetical protein